jgi:hypothetical protein
MLDQLNEILSLQTAADGLPRNKGEYRILEIDPLKIDEPSSRPCRWEYAFWGHWVFCVEPVTKCETKEEVLDFFEGFQITEIDDGMSKKEFPEAVLSSEEGAYHTISDNITVDVAAGRCFIIRDWDRTKRALRLFRIHANREELENWMGHDDGEDGGSWKMREYLVLECDRF